MRRTGLVTLLIASVATGFAACRNEIAVPGDAATTPPTPTVTPSFSPTATPPPDDAYFFSPTNVDSCYALLNVAGDVAQVVDTDLDGVSSFAAGRIAMLWQVKAGTAPSGSQTAISSAPFGAYELIGVAAVATNGGIASFQLASTPTKSYSASAPDRAQLCLLPRYGHLLVGSNGALVTKSWDGMRGGVVAFVADTADILGGVDVSARGFAGAPAFDSGQVCGNHNSNFDQPDSDHGGPKGESPDGHAATYGRGDEWTGGGGGNAYAAGGGGGGNGGLGGRGGDMTPACSDASGDLMYGLGGAAISAQPDATLSFGGGGGAGQGRQVATGGAGGGVALLIARSLTLGPQSKVTADGAAGHSAPGGTVTFSTQGGGGGGGAGGVILLVTDQGAVRGLLRANGGAGGVGTTDDGGGNAGGCGGSGAGGRILVEGAVDVSAATRQVNGGAAAACSGANNPTSGVMKGAPGTSQTVAAPSFPF